MRHCVKRCGVPPAAWFECFQEYKRPGKRRPGTGKHGSADFQRFRVLGHRGGFMTLTIWMSASASRVYAWS